MLGVNIPGAEDRKALREAVRAAGHRYIERLGWAVFLEKWHPDGSRVLSLKMCQDCSQMFHDRATCPHPRCHGFYAGTTDHDTWEKLWENNPDGDVLAVRTGVASGIFVVDFDLKHGAPEAHDRWHEVIGEPGTEDQPGRPGWNFPPTLRQTTKSGGFHLVYRYPEDGDGRGVRSRNSVTLRGIDVKGDGGLFRVDPTIGYRWHERVLPSTPTSELVTWTREAPVHTSGRRPARVSKLVERARRPLNFPVTPGGPTVADVSTFGEIGIGDRDTYVNMVAWLLRKFGYGWDEAVEIMRDEYDHLEKVDGDPWRWEWCEYKLHRAWRDVAPDLTVAAGIHWVGAAQAPLPGAIRSVTRRTIVPHPGR